MGETAYTRISGKLGSIISLDVQFYQNGVPTDPWAIREVKIYRSSVADENLIQTIPFLYPGDSLYPSPARRVDTGSYILDWEVPSSGIPAPDIFFDVWSFIPTDCRDSGGGGAGTGDTNYTDVDPCLDDEDNWVSQCGKFFLSPSGWYMDDNLEVPTFAFEALDSKFYQPEIRTLRVGIMPTPLYDYDYNLIAPMIPQLTATFTMWTENNELLIDEAPMKIQLRQGTYRTNPFLLTYKFNTSYIEYGSAGGCPLLKGTYKYRVSIVLPNGETRTSENFYIQIS